MKELVYVFICIQFLNTLRVFWRKTIDKDCFLAILTLEFWKTNSLSNRREVLVSCDHLNVFFFQLELLLLLLSFCFWTLKWKYSGLKILNASITTGSQKKRTVIAVPVHYKPHLHLCCIPHNCTLTYFTWVSESTGEFTPGRSYVIWRFTIIHVRRLLSQALVWGGVQRSMHDFC